MIACTHQQLLHCISAIVHSAGAALHHCLRLSTCAPLTSAKQKRRFASLPLLLARCCTAADSTFSARAALHLCWCSPAVAALSLPAFAQHVLNSAAVPVFFSRCCAVSWLQL